MGHGARTISQHQRDDMVILAYIRESRIGFLWAWGCPGMTEELQEPGPGGGPSLRGPSHAHPYRGQIHPC